MTRRRRGALAAAVVAIVSGAAGWTLFLAPFEAGPDVPEGYDRCGGLCIRNTGGTLVVEPPGGAESGLVFYTGARVPPVSYLEIAAGVAQAGHVVVVPELPLHRASLDSDAALDVIATRHEVGRWAIGGHGLGGATAAGLLPFEPVGGLVLVAAELGATVDLSESDVEVVAIYGTEDGVLGDRSVAGTIQRLPTRAEVVEVVGGTHGGFGDYGEHPGDGEATIPPTDQTRQTVDAITALMSRLSG